MIESLNGIFETINYKNSSKSAIIFLPTVLMN